VGKGLVRLLRQARGRPRIGVEPYAGVVALRQHGGPRPDERETIVRQDAGAVIAGLGQQRRLAGAGSADERQRLSLSRDEPPRMQHEATSSRQDPRQDLIQQAMTDAVARRAGVGDDAIPLDRERADLGKEEILRGAPDAIGQR